MPTLFFVRPAERTHLEVQVLQNLLIFIGEMDGLIGIITGNVCVVSLAGK
jgi:hypothetical protein